MAIINGKANPPYVHGIKNPSFVNGKPLYLLQDEFTTAQDNPLTSPRNCEPGPGTTAFRDTEGKFVIALGWLEWAAQASAVYAEQDVVSPLSITRNPGRILVNKWRCATDNPQYPLALVSSTTPAWNHTNVQHAFWRSAALTLSIISNATLGPAVCAFVADGTIYNLAIIQRSTGAFYYIKGGSFTYWTLLYIGNSSNTTPLYAASAGYTAVFSTSRYHLPNFRWLPTPLLYLTGAMTWPTTDGYVGDGGYGAGGGGLTMLDGGTWSVTGGYVLNTPGLGAELWDAAAAIFTSGTYAWIPNGINTIANVDNTLKVTYVNNQNGAHCFFKDAADLSADLIVGRWYKIKADLATNAGYYYLGVYNGIYLSFGNGYTNTSPVTRQNTFLANSATGCYMLFYGLAAGNILTVDNLSLKPIPNSAIFTNMALATTDVWAEIVIHALEVSTQAGIVQSDRSFASKCAAIAEAGQAVIALKEVTGVGGVGITTNDTITVGGVTYAIASVTGGSNVAYDDVAKTQTVTLGSNLGAQVNVDDKVGLDWTAWNGVLVYFDGAGNIKLDEVVAGVYTNRASTVVPFVADKRLIYRKIGTEYRWFFNEVLVTTTTAGDAAARAGKYYGMFSTYNLNKINNMVVYPTGSDGNQHAVLDQF